MIVALVMSKETELHFERLCFYINMYVIGITGYNSHFEVHVTTNDITTYSLLKVHVFTLALTGNFRFCY